jgi:hypothetical protein
VDILSVAGGSNGGDFLFQSLKMAYPAGMIALCRIEAKTINPTAGSAPSVSCRLPVATSVIKDDSWRFQPIVLMATKFFATFV